MKHADWAWLALAAGVVAYELAAARRSEWELLSEAADRYRHHHPILTPAIVAYLAAHLTRLIPKRIDPLHRVTAWAGR